MSTSTTFLKARELEALPEALARLRGHAALVRTLVDEVDRLAPPVRSSEAARFSAVSAQLAEEFRRLGSQILECAAAMSRVGL